MGSARNVVSKLRVSPDKTMIVMSVLAARGKTTIVLSAVVESGANVMSTSPESLESRDKMTIVISGEAANVTNVSRDRTVIVMTTSVQRKPKRRSNKNNCRQKK